MLGQRLKVHTHLFFGETPLKQFRRSGTEGVCDFNVEVADASERRLAETSPRTLDPDSGSIDSILEGDFNSNFRISPSEQFAVQVF